METKELRRSLKEWLAGLTKLQTELERLNTPENQEILNQYPIIDQDWRHPQSHLYERTLYFVEQTRKSMSKIVEALPRERKSKNDKKVVFKDINNEKPKKARTGQAPEPTRKRKRDSQDENGQTGDSGLSSGRKPRKPRSDKGKSRKS